MKEKTGGGLAFLYETAAGRWILKGLTARWLSRLAGAFCDSPLSRPLIGPFVRRNGIDLAEYESDRFACFNDCFTRKIRPELRPVCPTPGALVSPCDGLLSAYRLTDTTVFPTKQSCYTVASLLRDEALAAEFSGGVLLVFRLCVRHYHRYCYVDSGRKGENVFLPGRLHTVRPIALENCPVFIQNCREYTVLETEHFGRVVQCEIGAMLVGKIQNHHGPGPIRKGAEKGMFLYGGSSVAVLLKKGAATLPQTYFDATQKGEETPVRYGQLLGWALSTGDTAE